MPSGIPISRSWPGKVILISICLCTGGFPLWISAQTTLSMEQKMGDMAFEKADFLSAVSHYKKAGIENTSEKKARLRLAISLYEVNDVDRSLALLTTLDHEGNTSADVYFYMARDYEAKNQFAEAIGSYKHFLQRSKSNDARRSWVKDQLIRCANGSRIKYGDEIAYVENAGPTINSERNEFAVKYSPTNMGKIYFSSDRSGIVQPFPHPKIFSAKLDNGQWLAPIQLPAHINSGDYQEVCDFSKDGQVLYYLMKQDNQFRIRTDTFSAESNIIRQGFYNTPFDLNGEATDLTFFNDSICLYAADQAGGYGGYDLYIAFRKKEGWSAGINLGPDINSFYDERYPFLTRNGLTLFFSSNNLESMGGFDVFTSSFDPDTYTWSTPKNLGTPINTSGNETGLIIAPDGTSAYLVSDRKSGYGGQDIYHVLFKQPITAHQEISEIPTFQQVLNARPGNETAPEPPKKNIEIKEYYISHLFLEDNTDILVPQNIKKLDVLANLMLIYPKIMAELSCFEIPSGQQMFSLYFSIKKTEEVADYLVKKGIPRNRILLKGYGASFPMARLPEGTTNTTLYNRLNYRIEITLHDYEAEPVKIHMENISVPTNLMDLRGQKFNALRHGLYYSVQLVTISQILQNPNLESMDEMFIDMDNAQGQYHYMTGLLSAYKEAASLKQRVEAEGFPDAAVIAYVDGIRIKPADIPALAATYPDLLLFQENEVNK